MVLSACETGLLEITSNPDEFIGLPGTFMALGAAGVVGTLWPVNDTATALLMARFYELHIGERLPPASALSRAQAWLRQATNSDLRAYVENAVVKARIAPRLGEQIVQELSVEGLRRSRNSAAVEWITRTRVIQPQPPEPAPETRAPLCAPLLLGRLRAYRALTVAQVTNRKRERYRAALAMGRSGTQLHRA